MDIQNKHMHTTKTDIENIDIHIFIRYITNIKVENYKICFNDSGFVPNMSASLQTTLAAEAHLAEDNFYWKNCILRNCALWSGRSLSTFRRNALPRS
jgi:hypothetical protein